MTSCQNRIVFNGGNTDIPLIVTDPSQCNLKFRKKWQKPTWLIDLDYKPNADMLLYLKWARGYRQGSINSNNVGIETVNPKSVDTFEAGAKTSFRGAVPGYFNVAGFYNKFRDQQLAVNTVVAPKLHRHHSQRPADRERRQVEDLGHRGRRLDQPSQA